MNTSIYVFLISFAFLIFGIVMIASFLKIVLKGYQKLDDTSDNTNDKSADSTSSQSLSNSNEKLKPTSTI